MGIENRLVWTNDVMAFLCKRCNEMYSDEPCEPSDCLMLEELDKCEAVDAVEVVRCKDCVHYDSFWMECKEDHHRYAEIGIQNIRHDDFCSYGERKQK